MQVVGEGGMKVCNKCMFNEKFTKMPPDFCKIRTGFLLTLLCFSLSKKERVKYSILCVVSLCTKFFDAQ